MNDTHASCAIGPDTQQRECYIPGYHNHDLNFSLWNLGGVTSCMISSLDYQSLDVHTPDQSSKILTRDTQQCPVYCALRAAQEKLKKIQVKNCLFLTQQKHVFLILGTTCHSKLRFKNGSNAFLTQQTSLRIG